MAENGVDIAKAYVHLIPSLQGGQGAIAEAIVPGASKAGDEAGKQAGSKFSGAFKVGLAGIAAGAALTGAAFAGLYKVGETFDDVGDTIRIGTGATGEALDGLIDVAKNVGQTVPAEFGDIGTAVADINTRMGLTGDTLQTVASQYLQAGNILGEAVDVGKTSAAFNAFKIEGDDVSKSMDHLFQVSQATGIGMNDLAAQVSANAPAVQALGFSFNETAVLVGSLDKAGLNSTAVMASMSKGLVTLAKDGEQPKEAFKRVTDELGAFVEKGDDAGALDLASKVFGTRGASQFVGALKSGAINLDDLGKAAGQTSDSILGAGAETMDFAEQWMMFKNKILVWLEPAATAVFGTIGNLMKEVSDGVTAFGAAWEYNDGEITSSGIPGIMEQLGFYARQTFDYFQGTVIPNLQQFGDWIVKNQGWLTTLAVAVGAMAAAFYIWTGALAAWKAITIAATAVQAAFNVVMNLNPVGIIILAVIGLVAAIVYLATQTTFFQDVWGAVWGFIQTTLTNVGNFIGTVLNWIGTTWATVWLAIQLAASAVWGAIVGFITGYINNVLTIITTVLEVIRAVWSAAWDGISSFVSGVWEGIMGFFRGAIGTVSGIFESIGNAIMTPFRNAFDAIAGFWNSTVGKISFTIPDWVPGVGGNGWSVPNIPMLAKGGVVTKPTLAVVGEAGPEAVIPLSKLSQHLPEGRGTTGPAVVQNIHPAPGMSEETIGRVAANSLDYQLRMANA